MVLKVPSPGLFGDNRQDWVPDHPFFMQSVSSSPNYLTGISLIVYPLLGGEIIKPAGVGRAGLVIEPCVVGGPVDIGIDRLTGPTERAHGRIVKPEVFRRCSFGIEPTKSGMVYPGGTAGVEIAKPAQPFPAVSKVGGVLP